MKRLVLAAFLLLLVPVLQARVTLSPLFTDNAVLQRDADTPIWGAADIGEPVTVTFGGQTCATVADGQGRWEVRLTPLPANIRGNLIVRGNNVIVLKNIVTGDVWLCSGQSNMALRVREVTNAPAEITAADLPDIRQFFVPAKPSPDLQPDTYVKSSWQPASPQTAGDFTAAGFFFARELQAAIHVPIGLINSSVGGTPIQSWTPLDTLKVYPGYARMMERKKSEIAAWPARKMQVDASLKAWEIAAAAARVAHQPVPDKPWNPGPPDSGRFMPGQLYNGMIHPLIHYRLKGALWYQGEANAGGGPGGAADYTDILTRMITAWRANWGAGEFPFYLFQLPNYGNPGDATHKSWAFFREGQANVLSVPCTGMAVLIDIGDSGNIHPKNKQEAGRRMALAVLAGVYGRPVTDSGPVLNGSAVEGAVIRLHFDHADSGLSLRNPASAAGFEIAGADGKFIPADAKVEVDSVVVGSPDIPAPVYVRYAWANDPSVSLFNGAGFPAAPFRTDKFAK